MLFANCKRSRWSPPTGRRLLVVTAWLEEHSGMKQRIEVEQARPELKRKGRPRRKMSPV